MPKSKTHHIAADAHSHSPASHHNHKSADMEKVKIKRVKRNKKKITTAEKVMAGIGVGSTLMGGMGSVSPKPPTTNIVSTKQNSQNAATSKIKSTLGKIFGATFGAQTAKAALFGNSFTVLTDASGNTVYSASGQGAVYVNSSGSYTYGNGSPLSASDLAAVQQDLSSSQTTYTINPGASTITAPLGQGGQGMTYTIVDQNNNPVTSTSGVSVSSSNSSVVTASIASAGNIAIMPVGSGNATITISYGSSSASFTVNVPAPVQTTYTISPGASTITAPLGQGGQGMTYTIVDENGSDVTQSSSGVSVSSSNSSVATASVNSPGNITIMPVGSGNATITINYGSSSASFTVNVTTPLTVTAQSASTTPYDSSLNSQLTGIQPQLASLLQSGQVGIINGNSVTAFMLGWGGDPAGSIQTTYGQTYTFNGNVWTLQQQSSPVTSPISFSAVSLSAGTGGQYYSGSVASGASGGTGVYSFSLVGGSLPSGLTLNSDGSITGSISESIPTNTNFNFTVQVQDNSANPQTAQASFSMTIQNGRLADTPTQSQINVATASSLPSGIVGSSYNPVILSANGGEGVYTWSLIQGTSLPPGLSLSNGVITGTPTQAGSFAFTLQASDGTNLSGTQSFAVNVSGTASPQAPTETTPSILGIQGYNGTTNSYTNGIATSGQYLILYGNFSPNSDNTVSIDGQAANVSSQVDNQIDVLLGTLTSGSHTVTVSNAGGTSSQSTFTVAPASPQAPTETTPTINGVQGYNATTGAYTNNSAAAGQYLILYGSFSTNNDNTVQIDGQTANVTGQTTQQINVLLGNLSSGSHSVTVTNAGGTSSQSTFTVAPASPQAPTETTPSILGIQGYNGTTNSYTNGIATSGQYLILYGNFSPNSDNTVSIDGQAANVSSQVDNQIDVLLGTLTSGSHTVTVSNAGGTSSQSMFTVAAPASALAFSSAALPAATVGTAYSATLPLATGGSGAGYQYSLASNSSLPAGLSLSPGGVISGTPTSTSSGANITFTVTVTDNAGHTASQQFSIAVAAAAANVNAESLTTNIVSGNNFVGSSWTVSISGATPGATVYVEGGNSSSSNNTTPMGTVGSNGTFSLSGTFQSGDVGTWNETWLVGTTQANAVQVGQKLSFSVSAAAKTVVYSGNGAAPASQSLNLGADQSYWPGTDQNDMQIANWLQTSAAQAVLSQDTITANFDGVPTVYSNNGTIVSYTINVGGQSVTLNPQQLAAAINGIGSMILYGTGPGMNITNTIFQNLTASGLSQFQIAEYILGTAALQVPGAPATNLAITSDAVQTLAVGSYVYTPPTTSVSNSPNLEGLPTTQGLNDAQWVTPAQADAVLKLVQQYIPGAGLADGSAVGGIGTAFGTTTLSSNGAAYFYIAYTDPKTGNTMTMNVQDILPLLTYGANGQLQLSQSAFNQIPTGAYGSPVEVASSAEQALVNVGASPASVGLPSTTQPGQNSTTLGATSTGTSTGASAGSGSNTGSGTGGSTSTTIPINPITASGSVTLAVATVGVSYQTTLPSSGAWTMLGGSFPPGLSYTPSTNTISGTPTVAGTYVFTLAPLGGSGSTQFTLVVAPAAKLSTTTSGSTSGSGSSASAGSGAAASSSAGTGSAASTVQQNYVIQATSEASGQVGDTVTVSGTGFIQASGYQIQFFSLNNLGGSPVATATASAVPAFSGNNLVFQVPALSSGQYAFRIINTAANSVSNYVAFTVVSGSGSSTVTGPSQTTTTATTVSPIINGGTNTTSGSSGSLLTTGQLGSGSSSTAATGSTAGTSSGLLTIDDLSMATATGTADSQTTGSGSGLSTFGSLGSDASETAAQANSVTVLNLSSPNLNNNTLSLTVGDTDQSIIASATTNGTTDENITVASSNSAVATATFDPSTGIVTVTGASAGTSFITVHPADLGSDTSQDQFIIVNVTAAASDAAQTGIGTVLSITSPNLVNNTLNLTVGDTDQSMQASATTNGTTDTNITVTSSNSAVATATVDPSTGIITVTGVSAGTALLTVHPNDLGTDTSQDQFITVNVAAAASSLGAQNVTNLTMAFGSYSNFSFNTANGPVTVSTDTGYVQASLNQAAGYVAISAGYVAGTTTITIHPTAMGSDTSEDQIIVVNVQAPGSGGGGGGITYSGGVVDTFGSVSTQPVSTGLQMPTNFQGLQMQSGTTTDLSARYANVNGTIYDKQTGQAFSTPQQFFSAAGVSSFNGLIFDTSWQPSSAAAVAGAQSSAGSYTVKKGDTLSSIAKSQTGSSRNWRAILAANPKCLSVPGNTKTLKIGYVLNIPSIN